MGGKGTLDDLRIDIVRDSQLRQRFRIKELESWSYGLMKSLNPLQGPDVIAYEAWKDLQNDFFAKKRKYWHMAAEKLITMERVYQGCFGRKSFPLIIPGGTVAFIVWSLILDSIRELSLALTTKSLMKISECRRVHQRHG